MRDTLLDLQDFCQISARLVARGKHAYDADEALHLAGEAIVHRVGEAVARLDRLAPDFLADHPQIEWRKMKGMRNVVAHEYLRVDHEIIWNALVNRLPGVATLLDGVLRERLAYPNSEGRPR